MAGRAQLTVHGDCAWSADVDVMRDEVGIDRRGDLVAGKLDADAGPLFRATLPMPHDHGVSLGINRTGMERSGAAKIDASSVVDVGVVPASELTGAHAR